MRRHKLLYSALLVTGLTIGCRTPLMTPYANLVDDINDTHLYLDNWYCPRLDISRAGKPDWCGPINSKLSPGICYLGSWNRYDDENLYPPSHPYTFPSYTMPAPRVWQPPKADAAAPANTVPPQPSTDTLE